MPSPETNWFSTHFQWHHAIHEMYNVQTVVMATFVIEDHMNFLVRVSWDPKILWPSLDSTRMATCTLNPPVRDPEILWPSWDSTRMATCTLHPSVKVSQDPEILWPSPDSTKKVTLKPLIKVSQDPETPWRSRGSTWTSTPDLGILWQGGAMCMCLYMYCPGMVRVSWDQGCSVTIHVLSRDHQSISGSQDTLTRGWSVPIHVLSRDGQSILGSRGTQTRAAMCMCLSVYCLGMVKVSWDLGILWQGAIHVLSWDGQSISGPQDTLIWGCSVHLPIHVLSQDGQSIVAVLL